MTGVCTWLHRSGKLWRHGRFRCRWDGRCRPTTIGLFSRDPSSSTCLARPGLMRCDRRQAFGESAGGTDREKRSGRNAPEPLETKSRPTENRHGKPPVRIYGEKPIVGRDYKARKSNSAHKTVYGHRRSPLNDTVNYTRTNKTNVATGWRNDDGFSRKTKQFHFEYHGTHISVYKT